MKVALFLMSLIGKLPYPWVLRLGKWLGLLMLRIAKSRRDIAARNLKLCFPDLSDTEREELLRNNFISTGQGLLETAYVWNVSGEKLKVISRLYGDEHLIKAKESGQGVLLLGFHLTSLEIGGCCLANTHPMAAMYRQHRDPDFEQAMTTGRKQHLTNMIEREDVKSMLRALKKGETIWYAADQDYGPRHSVFAKFFDIDAATIVATSRFAKMTKAKVVPMTHFRDLKTNLIHVRIHPELEGFADLDEQEAAQVISTFLENYLRGHPADYMWLHRRFKTRPEGEASLYPPKSIMKMRRMLDSHFEKIIAQSEVLKGSVDRPEHIRLTDGTEMKFFYHKKWYQSSPARRFTRAWLEDSHSNIEVKHLFTFPTIDAEIVQFESVN